MLILGGKITLPKRALNRHWQIEQFEHDRPFRGPNAQLSWMSGHHQAPDVERGFLDPRIGGASRDGIVTKQWADIDYRDFIHPMPFNPRSARIWLWAWRLCAIFASCSMRNRVQPFVGDRLATGHAVSKGAILDAPKGRLDHPDLGQSCVSQAFQDLVAFTFRRTFLEIRVGRLVEFRLNPRQARVELAQPIPQAGFKFAHIVHRDLLHISSAVRNDGPIADNHKRSN
jgi:hypothetical protein